MSTMDKMTGLYPEEEVICSNGGYAVVVKSRESKIWLMELLGEDMGLWLGILSMPYPGFLDALNSRGVDNKTILQHVRIVEEFPIRTVTYLPCLPNRLRG